MMDAYLRGKYLVPEIAPVVAEPPTAASPARAPRSAVVAPTLTTLVNP